jgi:hypothetical protein
MILDYLWRYPPYITLLIMVDLVSVSYPPVYTVVVLAIIKYMLWPTGVGPEFAFNLEVRE